MTGKPLDATHTTAAASATAVALDNAVGTYLELEAAEERGAASPRHWHTLSVAAANLLREARRGYAASARPDRPRVDSAQRSFWGWP